MVNVRITRVCRSAQDDPSGTCRKLIGAIFTVVMQNVGGSTARGCGGCYDGRNDVKKVKVMALIPYT